MGTERRIKRTDAHGFVADFNRVYERETELRAVCGHRFYEERHEEGEEGGEKEGRKRNCDETDTGLSYYQIGRRTVLPVSLVGEGRYGYVSDAVVGALCEGEKSFLARRLSDSANEGGMPTVTVDGVGGAASRTVEAATDRVDDPDHLLLPRTEEYEEAMENWRAEGRVRKFGESRYLRVENGDGGDGAGGDEDRNRDEGGAGETDCWIHTYDTDEQRSGERDAFVLDDESVTVVQKKGEDVRPPAFGHVEEYDELSHDLPLTVYFGDEAHDGGDGKEEFFDVVYRVVVSEPVVGEGGACRLRLGETL